jgi:hypothetical protein
MYYLIVYKRYKLNNKAAEKLKPIPVKPYGQFLDNFHNEQGSSTPQVIVLRIIERSWREPSNRMRAR